MPNSIWGYAIYSINATTNKATGSLAPVLGLLSPLHVTYPSPPGPPVFLVGGPDSKKILSGESRISFLYVAVCVAGC